MKVIFLDIDGVLNNWSSSSSLDKKCINNFNKLLHFCNNVVLISAWRYIILRGDMTCRGFEQMLKTHRIYDKIKIVGTTREDSKISFSDRCSQVKDWISDRDIQYVILDDMDSLYEDEEVRKNLIVTDGSKGLTTKDIKKAIKILEG